MAYEQLKDDIREVIKANGTGAITGDVLQGSLIAMANNLEIDNGVFLYLSGENDLALSTQGDNVLIAWTNPIIALSKYGDGAILSKVLNNPAGANTLTLAQNRALYIRKSDFVNESLQGLFVYNADVTSAVLAEPNNIILAVRGTGGESSVSGKLIDLINRGQGGEVSNLNKYYTVIYNIAYDNIYINEQNVYIKPNGFGLRTQNGLIYYVADESKVETQPYSFYLGLTDCLVLDVTKLNKPNARNDIDSCVYTVPHSQIRDYHIRIAYRYFDSKIILTGQFADLYNKHIDDSSNITFEENNDIIFNPQYFAYAKGRINNDLGVGTGWYDRFRITHISDVHVYTELLSQSFRVSTGKVRAVCNTGDDANGVSASDAGQVMADLTSCVSATNSYLIPLLQVKGNHDVTGLTNKQYWDIVGNRVAKDNTVIWGDLSRHKMYGYVDFQEGEDLFRIVMLDSFDYDDGQFNNPYEYQSAVFSQSQIDWFISVLDDAKSKGINIITMMHYSFGDNTIEFNEEKAKPDAYFYQDAYMIPDIINAAQKGLNLNKTYTDSAGLNNITVNHTFTSTELKYVCHLFGHIHSKNEYKCQKEDGTTYDILMLGEAALGAYGNALNKAYRQPDSCNNIAFSVLEIDAKEKKIYRVSYGSYLDYDKSNSINSRTTVFDYENVTWIDDSSSTPLLGEFSKRTDAALNAAFASKQLQLKLEAVPAATPTTFGGFKYTFDAESGTLNLLTE